MDFADKTSVRIGSTLHYEGRYKKPLNCPCCAYGTDAPITAFGNVPLTNNRFFLILAMKCTHCDEIFVASYVSGIDALNTKRADFIRCYPSSASTPPPQQLQNISPRFTDLHNQAQTAEAHKLIDLAAMGYRTALEVLVKDFALNELDIPEADVVHKQLAAAISTFLNQDSLINSADVVRLLANDYTHFRQQYPQHDFTVLKHYYKIFLDLMVARYDAAHPPVARS